MKMYLFSSINKLQYFYLFYESRISRLLPHKFCIEEGEYSKQIPDLLAGSLRMLENTQRLQIKSQILSLRN